MCSPRSGVGWGATTSTDPIGTVALSVPAGVDEFVFAPPWEACQRKFSTRDSSPSFAGLLSGQFFRCVAGLEGAGNQDLVLTVNGAAYFSGRLYRRWKSNCRKL